MIQRIQTVYLLIVAGLLIAAMCLPMGYFTDTMGEHPFKALGMGVNGAFQSTWGLFGILMLSTLVAAEKYDPSRINRFVIDLASAFHRFYGNCRIQGADPAVQQARLALCIGVKNAIFNVLTMFKINVPEKM